MHENYVLLCSILIFVNIVIMFKIFPFTQNCIRYIQLNYKQKFFPIPELHTNFFFIIIKSFFLLILILYVCCLVNFALGEDF